jgi:hypothetical protein
LTLRPTISLYLPTFDLIQPGNSFSLDKQTVFNRIRIGSLRVTGVITSSSFLFQFDNVQVEGTLHGTSSNSNTEINNEKGIIMLTNSVDNLIILAY